MATYSRQGTLSSSAWIGPALVSLLE
jgi:hypothetical protein